MTSSVVITGMGCVTPLGSDVETSWQAAVAGESGIVRLPDELDERLPIRIGAPAPEEFDVGDISPKELRRMDRSVVLALGAAREAMEDAGLTSPTSFDGDRAGVAVASGIGGVRNLLEQHRIYLEKGPRRVSPFTIPMSLANMPSGIVGVQHGLRGPNLCHVTACAASAQAIGESMRAIQYGSADIMLAGGSESAILPLVIAGFAKMQALSQRNDEPDKASRPFDLDRDGFVLGEGAAVLVLEREEHARARGARILGYVRGYGSAGDAYHMAAPDPEGGGARRAMQAALEDTGLATTDIGHMNAHATSTPAGDEVEAAAVREIFGSHVEQLPVSATKGMTGHLLGAAGAAEAIFSVKALATGTLPPTLNLDSPDPECALDHVASKARPTKAQVAMSNSFGFGGVNASLVFERGES
jgi:3-oxoacyl-[acyl-carrier-protein] synthase II